MKKTLILAITILMAASFASAAEFQTKVGLELSSLEGINWIDNGDGDSVKVTIHNAADNGVVESRNASKGTYYPDSTITMVGDKFNLSYGTEYIYNLSTDYGNFYYNFTTPAAPSGTPDNVYTLTYLAGENGTIEGQDSKTFWVGAESPGDENNIEVTVEAIADAGYYFNGWSDGVTDKVRTDTSITEDTTVTALFEESQNLPYINFNGETLYVFPENHPEDNVVWGGYETEIGTSAQSSTDGKSNTEAIVAEFGEAEPYENQTNYAAKLCNDSIAYGFDDWYLPAKDELLAIYENQENESLNKADFASAWNNLDNSWSSTEYNTDNAYRFSISNGNMFLNNKDGSNYVRCVRESR